MSNRKTYGEIAYNAALKPYIVRGVVFEWKDTPPSVKAEYERAAKAVLRASMRRLMYDHECEQMTNGTLKPQYQRNKMDGTCTPR